MDYTYLSPDTFIEAAMAATKTIEQGNKCFILALALNCLGMLDKRTRVHYPRMHVSCSLLSLVVITTIIVCAALVNLLCRCLQTCEIFENTRQESLNTRVLCTRVREV